MTKTKTNDDNTKFSSGISSTATLSYEKYLTMGLSILHDNLSIREYKCATKKDYPIFVRGKDMRINIFWKKKTIYEFIVEVPFWYKINGHKDDRKYMRRWADHKLEMVQDALKRGKKK